ncbi:hypothetical protein ACFPIK_04870 [Algoriphagus aquatilis]|uniref:DUF4476 domain-containing protein n=1 Tax=Algoriphagus aquatilis TaxID=490186 RepID=A0ABW0BV58_9BACT|nr:hypothetical protein [Algoriphagus sp.]
MKKLAILVVLTLCCFTGFAKDPESKTFLALFKSSELKEHKTNIKSIENQFSPFFSTKTYDGNSELALIIEIPSCEFDACFLGEFLVNLGDGQKVQLQNLAFRLFDLSENQLLHQTYLAMYEESLLQKKKTSKATKATSQP